MKQNLRSPLSAAALFAGVILPLFVVQTAYPASANAGSRSRGAAGRVNETVRAGTVIAPDGQAAITSIDRKWDAKLGFGTLNEAAVTPDGRVYSREANLSRNPDGTITTRGTLTDFDGRSYNYTETTKQTSGGPVAVGKMVDEDGKVATYETTLARTAANQTKRTMVIKHADGTKETRVEMLELARVSPGV